MSDLCLDKDHKNKDGSMPSMTSYLSRMRNLVLGGGVASKSSHPVNGVSQRLVLVMGNPSADLDSFVSTVETSFWYNLAADNAAHPRKTAYVPILNLPSVKASDLWRLRPEFGVALRLALGESPDIVGKGGRTQGKTDVLKELITIADIMDDEGSALHKLFLDAKNSETQSSDSTEKQSLFLVDHNSPSIPGFSNETISARFTVSSCIDHHVDEHYVSQDADPRIVKTGIGSCTSLVVKHLREQGMWPSSESQNSGGQISSPQVDQEALQEISKLALAPILIDTWNLRAKGDKCSDTDGEVVRFLESVISTTAAQSDAKSPRSSSLPQHSEPAADWDRDAFFSCISTAKANSLDLLTMQEVFDRDYKAWTERTTSSSSSASSRSCSSTSSGKEINIGISSLVKPLSWLISHAATARGNNGAGDARGDGGGSARDAITAFLSEIEKFASAPDRQLGVFCMLTRTPDGRKEVAVLVRDEAAKGALDAFERNSRDELQLAEWAAEDNSNVKGLGLVDGLSRTFGGKGEWKIWWMGDTSKSRKQVGPLLREAVRHI
ncbi:uncharacterized protein Z519_00930 [Cladophialophora bantiana CBS 173.52]|uniref:DHHA2 domain-containing protein n=1 Tax=Cladophialophora bantiana (strain ATCC 10958 / CBS 173.52 / CDC B-1940 / NIH 8579) TaxID=1442370 RepID=A0A0D2GLJ6_CLAB1|nr:uncharacterized protein Z519_00930 [Cladophialophora bantiana CBS 173.52]KIW99267.1 hypothetical protein Z519_00930 [Cladophialophora bantiana CBS 173.52]